MPVGAPLQSAKGSTNGGGSLGVAYGSALTAQSLLMVTIVAWDAAADGIATPTDTASHTWVRAAVDQGVMYVGGPYNRICSWYAVNTGTATPTVNVTGDGDDYVMVISEWPGVDLTAPIGGLAQAGGVSAAPSSGNVTSTVNGSMLYGAATMVAALVITEEATFTLVQEEQGWAGGTLNLNVAYKAQNFATTDNADWTTDASTDWGAHVIVLNPVGSARSTVDLPAGGRSWRARRGRASWLGVPSDGSAPPVTGTLASTLDGVTLAATGTETFTGTLATTLAGATLAATGTEKFTGTLATTLAGATLAATGTETFTGTLATTLAGVTLAASGTETITGTLATTLAGVTLAAAGTETITGTLATTLAGAALAASGTVIVNVTGTLATTLAGVTLAATGTETFTGTLATTLAGATLAASGKETFSGTLATTLAGVTLAASGTETFTGTLATTLAGATLAASGTVTGPTISGTLATTLAGATLAASGAETITGTLAVTLEDATLAATDLVARVADLDVDLAGVTLAAFGTSGNPVAGVSETELARVTLVAYGTSGNPAAGLFATELARVTLVGHGTVGITVTGTLASELAGATLVGVG